jgi:hypothetical protein
MEAILTDIAVALLRSVLANFLARELVAVTLPSVIVFSALAYGVLTRDPIRRSLPPHVGLRSVWNIVCEGYLEDGRGLVRFSVFERDAFWITRFGVLKELFDNCAGQMVPQLQRSGGLGILTESERNAMEKVILFFLLI